MNEQIIIQDMKNSSDWIEKAKPIIENLLQGWQLVQIEGKDDDISKILDMSCGIDYLLISQQSSLILGIASRVQYGVNYRTFTIRKERESGALTEFQKRRQAISQGGLYPRYTMQVYIIDSQVKSLAIAKTEDLIEFIERGLADERNIGSEKIGQAAFYICKWDLMKYAGYEIREYNAA